MVWAGIAVSAFVAGWRAANFYPTTRNVGPAERIFETALFALGGAFVGFVIFLGAGFALVFVVAVLAALYLGGRAIYRRVYRPWSD
jgi:hypothetical protein